MLRLINLTLIFEILLSATSYSQDFGALTSKIFFGVDIKKQDTSLLSDFKTIPELTLVKDTGWTAYAPANDKNSPVPFHRFSFSKHPYFTSGLSKGGLVVMANRDSKMSVGMSILFSFQSVTAFDSAYNNLKEQYAKCASKTIKRPNIAAPYEVIKYLSKDGKDNVIVTKGEEDNKPYIHVAYNSQGSGW